VIVLLAVFKNNLPADITGWGIFAMIIVMMATIHLYAKKRKRDKEQRLAASQAMSQSKDDEMTGQLSG
jgi:putative membrane protein